MLKYHPEASSVQLEGCITLASLAKGDEQVKQSITAAGGQTLVLQALQRHKKNTELQTWGLRAVRAITAAEDYKAVTGRKYGGAAQPVNRPAAAPVWPGVGCHARVRPS